MKQNVVFFGSGTYTIPIIETLLKHNFKLVITTEKNGEFIDFIRKNNLLYLISNLKKAEDIEKIKGIHAPVAVLASYGAIIPSSVLAIFKHGILNIHPSLLPKHRGPSPIQATILEGDKKTGVSIIKLDDKVDHGPILAQETIQLNRNETMQQLKQSLFDLGSQMVEELLIKLENGEKLNETEQDHSRATFTKKISRDDGFVDTTKPPISEVLKRMIRAYHPWPGVWTKARIIRSTSSGQANKELRIKLLPNSMIQVEGKRVMTYKEFVNGYQEEGKELLQKLRLL